MAWVEVKERMPVSDIGAKFKVKMVIGPTGRKQETVMLVSKYSHGSVFAAGDWRTVTHWWEEELD